MGTALGTALIYSGNIDAGIDYCESSWQGVKQANNPFVYGIFGHELILTLTLAKYLPKARQWADTVIPFTENTGVFEAYIHRPTLIANMLSGHADNVNQSALIVEKIESRGLMGCTYEDVAAGSLNYLRLGEFEKARDNLISLEQRQFGRWNLAAVYGCKYFVGLIDVEEKKYHQAQTLFQEVVDFCRDNGNVLFEIWGLTSLVEVLTTIGELDHAQQGLQRIEALMTADKSWYGLETNRHFVRALVASKQGKFAEAEAAFSHAQEISQQFQIRWDEAKILFMWGQMLMQSNEDAAKAKLEEAQSIYEAMQAPHYARKVAEVFS